MDYTIGIGEYAISNQIENSIITYALGSCVAVIFHCPVKKVGAMIHIALPTAGKSSIEHKKGYYADEGLRILIDQLWTEYKCTPASMNVTLIGGADSKKANDIFRIGKRNLETIKMILEAENINYLADDVGGHVSRTVTLNVNTGTITIVRLPMMV